MNPRVARFVCASRGPRAARPVLKTHSLISPSLSPLSPPRARGDTRPRAPAPRQLCASVAAIGASQRELVASQAQLAAALAKQLAPAPQGLGLVAGLGARPVTPLGSPPPIGASAPLGAPPRDGDS